MLFKYVCVNLKAVKLKLGILIPQDWQQSEKEWKNNLLSHFLAIQV